MQRALIELRGGTRDGERAGRRAHLKFGEAVTVNAVWKAAFADALVGGDAHGPARVPRGGLYECVCVRALNRGGRVQGAQGKMHTAHRRICRVGNEREESGQRDGAVAERKGEKARRRARCCSRGALRRGGVQTSGKDGR